MCRRARTLPAVFALVMLSAAQAAGPEFTPVIGWDQRIDASWASFVKAAEVGTFSFLQNAEKFAAPEEVSFRLKAGLRTGNA